MDLSLIQKDILITLITLYQEHSHSVKGEEIADVIQRNPGTVRNQMQALKTIGLVDGVPGPKGGYIPTALAYKELSLNVTEGDYDVTIDATNRLLSPSATARAHARVEALLEHSAAGLLLRQKLFSGLLLPHVSEAVRQTGIAQTGADMAALACALELYRRQHGQFPDTLPRLVPDFIARVPHDIINGHPLKYRRTDNGLYVLYSVGWNEADDGGEVVLGKGGEVDRLSGGWVWQPVCR